MDIARTLDDTADSVGKEYRVEESPGAYYAGPLVNVPSKLEPAKPVNVASVAKLSPFRYPGGKTWLIPYIRTWLLSKASPPSRFVEPFAGGGISGLTVAFEDLAKQVVLGEMDEHVAAVWRVILNGHAEWLAQKILRFDLTGDGVRRALNAKPTSLPERAFQTILRNRVQRGGIMAPGAGLVKEGEAGKGLASRWYPETLAERIRAINARRHKIAFVHGDGFQLMEEYSSDRDAVFFVDPPYTIAAKRLYSHWQVDHRRLFEQMAAVRGDFLMTYDNTPEVLGFAAEFGFATRPVTMKNTHHAKMTELLIGKNLAWLG